MSDPAAGQEPKPVEGQEPITPPNEEPRQEQGTFDAEYVKTLRDENAKTRKRLRELEEKEEADKKARMSEVDRLREEQKEAADRVERADAALKAERLTYTAERLAVKLGGKPERAEGIARLANLSGIDFDDEGKPASAQVEAAIKKTLEEYPELKVSKRLNDEGFTPPPDELEAGEKNPFDRNSPHFHLGKQGELFEKNPELARRLQKAARS